MLGRSCRRRARSRWLGLRIPADDWSEDDWTCYRRVICHWRASCTPVFDWIRNLWPQTSNMDDVTDRLACLLRVAVFRTQFEARYFTYSLLHDRRFIRSTPHSMLTHKHQTRRRIRFASSVRRAGNVIQFEHTKCLHKQANSYDKKYVVMMLTFTVPRIFIFGRIYTENEAIRIMAFRHQRLRTISTTH